MGRLLNLLVEIHKVFKIHAAIAERHGNIVAPLQFVDKPPDRRGQITAATRCCDPRIEMVAEDQGQLRGAIEQHGFVEVRPGNSCGFAPAPTGRHAVFDDAASVLFLGLQLQGQRTGADAAGLGLDHQRDFFDMAPVESDVVGEGECASIKKGE